MQARYVILRLLLECGRGLVKVEKVTAADGEPDILVTLDRSLIDTTGKPVIGDLLTKLQVSYSRTELVNVLVQYYSIHCSTRI